MHDHKDINNWELVGKFWKCKVCGKSCRYMTVQEGIKAIDEILGDPLINELDEHKFLNYRLELSSLLNN